MNPYNLLLGEDFEEVLKNGERRRQRQRVEGGLTSTNDKEVFVGEVFEKREIAQGFFETAE